MGSAENRITQDILTWLRYKGHDVWRQNTGRTQGHYRTGKPGVPDIIGYHRYTGAFIGIECKRRGSKPTTAQWEFHDRLKAAGGIACIAHGLGDVVTAFYDYEHKS